MGFDTAIERVLAHEGGYVNHPKDPGGETNWGITKRLAMAYGYKEPMRKMTREQAKAIYQTVFWRKYAQLGGALVFQLFDAAVNHGHGNAIRFLQRAVNVADDGVMGKVTLAAVRRLPVSVVVVRLLGERLRFYTKLSRYDTFGRGWVNRLAQNIRYAVQDGCSADLLRHADKLARIVNHQPRFDDELHAVACVARELMGEA